MKKRWRFWVCRHFGHKERPYGEHLIACTRCGNVEIRPGHDQLAAMGEMQRLMNEARQKRIEWAETFDEFLGGWNQRWDERTRLRKQP